MAIITKTRGDRLLIRQCLRFGNTAPSFEDPNFNPTSPDNWNWVWDLNQPFSIEAGEVHAARGSQTGNAGTELNFASLVFDPNGFGTGLPSARDNELGTFSTSAWQNHNVTVNPDWNCHLFMVFQYGGTPSSGNLTLFSIGGGTFAYSRFRFDHSTQALTVIVRTFSGNSSDTWSAPADFTFPTLFDGNVHLFHLHIIGNSGDNTWIFREDGEIFATLAGAGTVLADGYNPSASGETGTEWNLRDGNAANMKLGVVAMCQDDAVPTAEIQGFYNYISETYRIELTQYTADT